MPTQTKRLAARATQKAAYRNTNYSSSSEDAGSSDENSLSSADDEPFELVTVPPESKSVDSIVSPESSGVSDSIKTQLVTDILRLGGIDSPLVSVYRLCDRKPDIYGSKSSKQRKQIQNKFNRWRSDQRSEYDRLVVVSTREKNRAEKRVEAKKQPSDTPLLATSQTAPAVPFVQQQLSSPTPKPPVTRRLPPTPPVTRRFQPQSPTMNNNFLHNLLNTPHGTFSKLTTNYALCCF
jgi:hypothetical protein